MRRLFDFLEANAGSYWSVPTLAEAEGGVAKAARASSKAKADRRPDREKVPTTKRAFEAAYEGVVYRDSTRDGREGDTLRAARPPRQPRSRPSPASSIRDCRSINTLAQAWLMAALRFAAPLR